MQFETCLLELVYLTFNNAPNKVSKGISAVVEAFEKQVERFSQA